MQELRPGRYGSARSSVLSGRLTALSACNDTSSKESFHSSHGVKLSAYKIPVRDDDVKELIIGGKNHAKFDEKGLYLRKLNVSSGK